MSDKIKITEHEVAKRIEVASNLGNIMLAKLLENIHKPNWNCHTIFYLSSRLKDEVKELEDSILVNNKSASTYENIRRECGDVANFTAMILDHIIQGLDVCGDSSKTASVLDKCNLVYIFQKNIEVNLLRNTHKGDWSNIPFMFFVEKIKKLVKSIEIFINYADNEKVNHSIIDMGVEIGTIVAIIADNAKYN